METLTFESLGAEAFEKHLKFYLVTEGEALEHAESFISKANEISGGSTVYDGKGSWIGESGELEQESVQICEIFHNLEPEKELSLVENFKEYGVKTDQEMILFESNGIAYFLKPGGVSTE